MKKITPEDQQIIKERFPKFSKIQACMCNNPDYGISLSPEAEEWLNRASRAKYGNSDASLAEEQDEAVWKFVADNFDTVKTFINWMVTEP